MAGTKFPALVQVLEDEQQVWAGFDDVVKGWRVCVKLVPESDGLVIAEVRVYPRPPKAWDERKKDEERARDLVRFWDWGADVPRVPKGGMMASKVRNQLKLGELSSRAVAATRLWADAKYPTSITTPTIPPWLDALLPRSPLATAARKPKVKKGRKPTRDDLFWAERAELYWQVANTPGPEPFYVRLAKLSGYSVSYCQDLTKEARDRGMLTPGTRGKAGGQLTDKAKRILERARKDDDDGNS